MPELPEVENVRRSLLKKVVGKKIISIESNYPKMVQEDFNLFKEKLINKEIKDILRYGKFLIFKLDDIYLLSHLRMEGKYLYEEKDFTENKHIHMVFNFSDSTRLSYKDTRKFGIMITKEEKDLYTTKPLSNVGPDPFMIDNIDNIFKKIKKSNKPIKEILLDQSIISGIGNIYANEILFKSKILPTKKGKNITKGMLNNIINNSKEILSLSISLGGSTIKSFEIEKGHIGSYQDKLLVHTKTNCPICNNLLTKEFIGGRSAYYCKLCQH